MNPMNTKTASLEEIAEEKIQPCEHMTDYVSALSDGSLRGPAYWFTRLHLLYCHKCGSALRGFQHLRTHLHILRDVPKDADPLAPETRAALQKALDDMDDRDS